jgi:hypothetical protein
VGEARGLNVEAIDPVADGGEDIWAREGVRGSESSHSRVRV